MPFVDYDEAQAVCSDCGRAFPSEEALAEHRRETHDPSSGSDPGDPPRAEVPCAVCGARFRSVAALAAHNRQAHTR